MAHHDGRLKRLESTIIDDKPAADCFVFGDVDLAAEIAQFRAARQWPDDGARPVRVTHFGWKSGNG